MTIQIKIDMKKISIKILLRLMMGSESISAKTMVMDKEIR
jgi:hypothetical protein